MSHAPAKKLNRPNVATIANPCQYGIVRLISVRSDSQSSVFFDATQAVELWGLESQCHPAGCRDRLEGLGRDPVPGRNRLIFAHEDHSDTRRLAKGPFGPRFSDDPLILAVSLFR